MSESDSRPTTYPGADGLWAQQGPNRHTGCEEVGMLTWQQPSPIIRADAEVGASSPMRPSALLSSEWGQTSGGPDSILLISVLNPLTPGNS